MSGHEPLERMDFDNHKGHGHSLPCSVGCEICDVAEPVDGDPWMLKRFLEAQDDKGTLQQALVELRATKSTDWIWFVFPQIWGLATNPTRCSSRFALRPGGEAYEYAHHPELLSRLTQACNALLQNERPLSEIMPKKVDRQKLRSSMTLFEVVAEDPSPYTAVLKKFFNGIRDEKTIEKLDSAAKYYELSSEPEDEL